MLETGFVPKDFAEASTSDSNGFCYSRILEMTKIFPSNWKGDKSYYINFVLPDLPNDICKFFCLVAGEDILATCTIQGSKMGYSFLFDPTIYIVETKVANPRLFQNMKGLSLKFKNEISFQLKTFVLSKYNIPHNNLAYLPIELILHILGFMNKYDIKNVCRTCRRFDKLENDLKLRSIMSKNDEYSRVSIRLYNPLTGTFM